VQPSTSWMGGRRVKDARCPQGMWCGDRAGKEEPDDEDIHLVEICGCDVLKGRGDWGYVLLQCLELRSVWMGWNAARD
jgi:hypothetical protein